MLSSSREVSFSHSVHRKRPKSPSRTVLQTMSLLILVRFRFNPSCKPRNQPKQVKKPLTNHRRQCLTHLPVQTGRLKNQFFLTSSTLQLENQSRMDIIGTEHALSRRTKGQSAQNRSHQILGKCFAQRTGKSSLRRRRQRKWLSVAEVLHQVQHPKGPKKKSAVATARKLRVNPSPSGEPTVVRWEVIPKFCVPAMPKAAPAKAELHRPELRQLIKNKIQELEFKVALELFSAVARLVPKEEVRKNPKAKAALDKEWENFRTKGVWDESRVRECKLYILVGFLKPAMKRVPNFQLMTLVESSRVVRSSRATMSATRILTTRCLRS